MIPGMKAGSVTECKVSLLRWFLLTINWTQHMTTQNQSLSGRIVIMSVSTDVGRPSLRMGGTTTGFGALDCVRVEEAGVY